MTNHKIGDRVRVIMGLDSGKFARVIDKKSIKLDGRGIPDIGRGHYNPMRRSDVAIQFDDGTLDVHDRHNLQPA